jgi:trafficking protein particle complex subunit 8
VIPTYASNALSSIHPPSSEVPPKALLRALTFAARWEGGIPTSEFLGDILGGERWLVWAAGDVSFSMHSYHSIINNSAGGRTSIGSASCTCRVTLCKEELQTQGSVLVPYCRQQTREAWHCASHVFTFDANELTSSIQKPLTIHFLRRAHELYLAKPIKLLSPSFWDTVDQSSKETGGFDAVLAGVEHPLGTPQYFPNFHFKTRSAHLGRLLYTTGDVVGAVKLFIGLLRGSMEPHGLPNRRTSGDTQQEMVPDKLFLEDFKTAFSVRGVISC